MEGEKLVFFLFFCYTISDVNGYSLKWNSFIKWRTIYLAFTQRQFQQYMHFTVQEDEQGKVGKTRCQVYLVFRLIACFPFGQKFHIIMI